MNVAQKRIFALWGVGSCGKTWTLRLVAREVSRSFFNASSDIDLEPLPPGDITTVITVSTIRGDVKIGITSQGDPNTGLLERLKELDAKGCEIIFCATRTTGGTVSDVEEMEKGYGYRTTWVTNRQTGYVDERSILNQRSAEELVSLMRFMCLI